MLQVISPVAENPDWATELIEFCRAHPVPGIDPALARRLLTRMARSPNAVLEVWSEAGRLAVTVVVDTCASADGSADLALLGLAPGGLDADAVTALLARAEDIVRMGPCLLLDVSLDPLRASWEPILRARGYAHAYSLFSMERPADAPQVDARAPLPEGWSWQRVQDDWFADYHRVVTAAFATVPGTFVTPFEQMAAWLTEAPRRPSVLVQDGHVRAFCAVEIHDTPEGRVGELRSLGRDPACHGLGLGDHIVLRGITELCERGVDRLELGVAARNTAALQLYERHGFHVTVEIPVMRRHVPR